MVEALLFRPMADSVGLTLGPHKVRFELADPTHQVISASNTRAPARWVALTDTLELRKHFVEFSQFGGAHAKRKFKYSKELSPL
jgi:hypothetical protein